MPKMIGYQEQINGLVFLSEDTDGGATVEFDIPAGYASIEWHFYNIHPATDNVTFGFQVNAAGGSGYDEYITSSYFRAKHNEDDSATGLDYIGDLTKHRHSYIKFSQTRLETITTKALLGFSQCTLLQAHT